MNNFILIGFDRSGTSAISRTLAKHPKVELVFRPFNSGPIRQKMFQILNESNVSEEDIHFFEELQNGVLYSEYIVSDWHKKFSTIQNSFKPGHLHTIITNLNHFSTKWVAERFPLIEQWAIWRDPLEILNSCMKNQFYGNWYGNALQQVFQSVKNDIELRAIFKSWIDKVEVGNTVLKTAFLIATLNYFLFKNIKKGKIIDYEVFRYDPNQSLFHLLKYFELEESFDFTPFLNLDLNSIPSIDGYQKNKRSEKVITSEETKIAKDLFAPLYELYKEKQNNKIS